MTINPRKAVTYLLAAISAFRRTLLVRFPTGLAGPDRLTPEYQR